jgi:predicted RNA-binding Zn-ribbon protein involved in translation (DUF1610 family)
LTVRNTLQCTSCNSNIVTRTQLGHKDIQEHSFPCPKCGIKITYVLDLDQKKASYSFREPQNAKWTSSEGGAIEVLTFSDEVPVPTNLPDMFSPFVATFGNFKDWKLYRHDETLRGIWVRSHWPYCERCTVHFERGNWDLFDKESPPTDGQILGPGERLVALYNAIQGGFSKFTLNTPGMHRRITQRLTLAQTISRVLYSRLANEFLDAGKILKLWKEIANIRRSFVNNYSALQPLLQIAYWHEYCRDIQAFRLSDKRFDALRQLYVDCFETLCRLMVIAVGIEAIIHGTGLRIPTKNGSISLEDFERFPNGNKPDIIKRYPIADLFLPVIDSNLRNGIGHHSAHYEAQSDEIVLHHTKESGTTSRAIPYTGFCDRVLKLFAAFELGAMYHHALHLYLQGKLS